MVASCGPIRRTEFEFASEVRALPKFFCSCHQPSTARLRFRRESIGLYCGCYVKRPPMIRTGRVRVWSGINRCASKCLQLGNSCAPCSIHSSRICFSIQNNRVNDASRRSLACSLASTFPAQYFRAQTEQLRKSSPCGVDMQFKLIE